MTDHRRSQQTLLREPTITWLRGLAEKGGKGVVNNIDARSLGRIADLLEEAEQERERNYHLRIADKLADRIRDMEATAKRDETCFLVVHDLVEAAREDLRLKVENAPAELVQAINMALYALRSRSHLSEVRTPEVGS